MTVSSYFNSRTLSEIFYIAARHCCVKRDASAFRIGYRAVHRSTANGQVVAYRSKADGDAPANEGKELLETTNTEKAQPPVFLESTRKAKLYKPWQRLAQKEWTKHSVLPNVTHLVKLHGTQPAYRIFIGVGRDCY